MLLLGLAASLEVILGKVHRDLDGALPIVQRNLVSEFAHVFAVLSHPNHLVATRHELSDAVVLGKLPVPVYAGCRLVLFQVIRDKRTDC